MYSLQHILELIAVFSPETLPIVQLGLMLATFKLFELQLHVKGGSGTWVLAWWGRGSCGSLAQCPGPKEAGQPGLLDTFLMETSDENVQE